MRVIRIILVLLALVVLLLALTAPVGAEPPRWHQAVGDIEDGCTLWAVRPRLLVTASHCVGGPGSTYTGRYYRGVQAVTMKITHVWDGALAKGWYADVALFVPESPWPVSLALVSVLPTPGTILTSVSQAGGVRNWVTTLRFRGLHQMSGYGWAVISDVTQLGPGASGSPLLVGGRVVGMHSGRVAVMGIAFGVPAGHIARALRDLDRYGPMQDRTVEY